jgi:hypothetical protein
MVEWTKIDTQTQKTEPLSDDSSSGSTAEIPRERERQMAVTAVAAYQWLKAALFAQLFWNVWSPSHPSAAFAVNSSSGASENHAAFLLLVVALYLVVLGLGLWNLQKWALVLLLLIWLPDFAYDLRPESFGLEHTAELWLGDQALFLFIGITIADAIAFTFFVNPKTYRAFNAEDEVKILEWLRWWT